MRLRNILTYILFMTALAASAQINTDQVMRIGRNALYFEDYVLSIQYFNQVIQAKPYLAQPYFYRAIAKLNLEDYRGAEEDADIAISQNPFIVDAYEVRGVARQNQGKLHEAIADYAKALSMLPENRQIQFNKALAEEEIEDYDAARTSFDKLLKAHPGFDNGYIGRAKLNIATGDTVAARSDLDKALELNKNATNAYVMRANLAITSGSDYEAALKDMNEAIRLQPKFVGFFINRAFLRYNLDDFFGAMADYDYALQLEPLNRVALYNRGLLEVEVRDVNKAIADFSRVLQIDPNDYRALYNRAVLYNDIRDFNNALTDLDKVIAAYPQFAGAYSLRSEIYRNKGDLRNAEADYKHVQHLIKQPVPKSQSGSDLADNTIKSGTEDDSSRRSTPADEETQEQVAAKFTSLLTIENNTDPDQEYNNSSIRGRVQDRNLTIEIEPMFTLSFYSSPNELAESTYFNKEVDDINATRMLRFLVMITNREPHLSQESGIKKHFESIEYYNSLIASRSPRAVDYFGRAMDFMTIRNYKAAIEDLDRALALTPDFTLCYFLRSVARYRLAKAEAASAPGENTDIRLIRDNIKIAMSEVMADIDKTLALSPRFAMAYFNKGNMLLEQRDYTSALSAFTKAIENKPDMGEAYYNRGYVYFRLGNKEAGSADLSKAGELGILPSYNLLKRMSN